MKFVGVGKADPERRAQLTREQVVTAAIELADQDGIESISMRRLAQELGVEAMSLYTRSAVTLIADPRLYRACSAFRDLIAWWPRAATQSVARAVEPTPGRSGKRFPSSRTVAWCLSLGKVARPG